MKESVTRSTSRGRSPHPSPHRPHYNPGPPSHGPMRTGPIMGTGPMTYGQPRASSSSRPMAPGHPSVVHRYSSPVNQTGVLGPLPVPALVPPVLVPGPPSVPLSQSHSPSLRQKSPAFGEESVALVCFLIVWMVAMMSLATPFSFFLEGAPLD